MSPKHRDDQIARILDSYRQETETLTPGTPVFHRGLRLKGSVLEDTTDPTSILIDFEDGETREVSRHLLDVLSSGG